jgi:hypothetical protein
MFRSRYSVYCLCVNVYCTAATGCQLKCSYIYIYIYIMSSNVFMQSTGYFCQILIKPEYSRQIFEKYSNTEFHENPSSGSRDAV